MNEQSHPAQPMFRVWIAGYRNWRPARWDEVPPAAVALEPAEEGCLVLEKARVYIEGFNARMLAEARPLWAVAIRVSGRYEGDPQPGEGVQGERLV